MKQIILSAVVLFSLTIHTFASPVEPVNEKAKKTFDELFKDADQVSWMQTGDRYEAYFTTDGVKTRALLDAKGNLVQTIRYYGEEHLPANLLYTVTQKYPGKKVHGVTEIADSKGVSYRIVLKDDKNYMHLNAGNSGDIEVAATYKRGDK